MSPRRRAGKRILKALLPIALLLLLAVVSITAFIVYSATYPPQRSYLVTPESFSYLSARGLKTFDETWANRDGTRNRGWLLRGAEGAPAVVLLHRYGADRSWLFNLGVKLNETTNFTVLWPDLRGHGPNPPVGRTRFGTREGEDVEAALDYLRGLKTPQGRPLVGEVFGLYGVEMGAYAALRAADQQPAVRSLVLDSIPNTPDDLLRAAVRRRAGMDNRLIQALARTGTHISFLGQFANVDACYAAASLAGRHILLLAGNDAPEWRNSTIELAKCFPSSSDVALKSDLAATGYNLPFVSSEQDEAYDRHVIDFFDKTLRSGPNRPSP
jgi:pimeloyl-ACP methyl ester carboxylesterase